MSTGGTALSISLLWRCCGVVMVNTQAASLPSLRPVGLGVDLSPLKDTKEEYVLLSLPHVGLASPCLPPRVSSPCECHRQDHQPSLGLAPP